MKLILKIFIVAFFFICSTANSQVKEDSVLDSIKKHLYDDPDTAILQVKKLINSEKNLDKKIKYLLFLSNAYTAKRNTDESYKTLIKAQELLKSSKDLHSKIISQLLIASQYQQMELYNKSFEALDQVDSLSGKLSDSNKEKYASLGKSFALKGMIYKSQGNLDISLQKFLSAITNLEKSTKAPGNSNNLSIIYYNIGYIYLNKNQFSTAEKHFNKSISYASESKAKSLEAYAMKGLAENYTFQKQNDKALQILQQAAAKSNDIGDLILDEGIYKGLAENYLVLGKFDDYLKNNEKYKRIKFQREQGDLKSINSLIDNMDLNKTTEINTIRKNHFRTNLILIILSILISAFLFLKSLKKYKTNKISRQKIAKLIMTHDQ